MTTFGLSLIGVVCLFVHSINACGFTATPQGLKTVVLGSNSGGADDAPSKATCPDGSVPVDCYCSVSSKCDGTSIRGQICFAFNRGGNPSGVQAVAVCLSGTDDSYQTVISGEIERLPKASCPCGYYVEACMLNNPWAQSGCSKPAYNEADKTCGAATSCNGGRGCVAIAVCRAK